MSKSAAAKRGQTSAKNQAGSGTAAQTGSFVFKDSSKYDGEYKDVGNGVIVRNGEGRFFSAIHEATYIGAWADDKLNGKGRVEYKSGAYYEGTFKDNRYDGEGRFAWPDGSSYVGMWRDNKMNGDGKYTGAKGDAWSGNFVDGNAEGLKQQLF